MIKLRSQLVPSWQLFTLCRNDRWCGEDESGVDVPVQVFGSAESSVAVVGGVCGQIWFTWGVIQKQVAGSLSSVRASVPDNYGSALLVSLSPDAWQSASGTIDGKLVRGLFRNRRNQLRRCGSCLICWCRVRPVMRGELLLLDPRPIDCSDWIPLRMETALDNDLMTI